MRILFIYPDTGSAVGYSAGIGVLSAILKKQGHETKLIHISDELDYPLNQVRINQDIRDYQPGLICFSVVTNQWYFARKIGKEIKKEFNIPIMVGGHHPTAVPQKMMEEPWVDIICCGEGDKALPEVVRRIESNLPMDGVANLLYRKNNTVVQEPLGSWIKDLDSLPFEDRDIFDYKKIVDTRSGWAEVVVTRGCPYNCSYCFNQPLFDKYKKDFDSVPAASLNKKDYIRRRSVDSTISMLKELKAAYPNIKGFTFVDDIMAMEDSWLEEFAVRITREVGLPYVCTSQPLLFNSNVAALLEKSGCKVVKMGIEAGNVEIRKKVLKRNISNEKLIEVFGIARKFGLKCQSFNMIGIPGETIENMMETIRLNAFIKPYIVWVSTFNPYPGTELYEQCEKKDMIDETKWNQIHSYRSDSVLKDQYLPRLDFKKIRIMFRWFLNTNLKNKADAIYYDSIHQLSSLPERQWRNGTVEKIFQQRDVEIDEDLRKKKVDHYVGKKYINIYWGKEYAYDLT